MREVRWRIVADLLRLPIKDGSRESRSDALADAILAHPRVASLLGEAAAVVGTRGADPAFRASLEATLAGYTATRVAASDIATALIALGTGAVTFQKVTPGAFAFGPLLATAIAQQSAIASFPLGAAAGGAWYGVFPATASPLLVAGSTAGTDRCRRDRFRLRGDPQRSAATLDGSPRTPAARPHRQPGAQLSRARRRRLCRLRPLCRAADGPERRAPGRHPSLPRLARTTHLHDQSRSEVDAGRRRRGHRDQAKSMDVVDLPLERLIPYARNPRKNAAAVATVAASLKEFGWRQPIVVDEAMVILAGHTRLEAARQLGLASAPVHVARGLTPAQAKAYRLMDNRASENAEWDEALLGLELGDLQGEGFDLGADRLRRRRAEPAAGRARRRGRCPRGRGRGPRDAGRSGQPAGRSLAARAAPAALRRQHRGDRRRARARRRDAAADGQRPALRRRVRSRLAEPGRRRPKTRRTGKVLNDDRADWREAWALFPGDVAYVWHGALHATTVAESLGGRLRHPLPDHLGQGAARAQPRRLSLAA
jgi:ParB-like chromosome segregation protein Spo0J